MSYAPTPPPLPPTPSAYAPAYTSPPPAPPPKALVHSSPFSAGPGGLSSAPPVPPQPQAYQNYGQEGLSAQTQAQAQGYSYPPRSSSRTDVAPQADYPSRSPADQAFSPSQQQQQQQQQQQYYQQQQQQQQYALESLPQVEPPWLPPALSLPSKSKSDLTQLLQTPALLDSILQNPQTTHPSLPASTAQLQQHLEQNLHLAQTLQNLSRQLAAQRASTSAQLLRARALESRFRKKQGELEERLGPWGARRLHARLVREIGEGEQVCRGVEESFVEDNAGMRGEREVGEWIRRVKEGRRVLHLRRERRRRWEEGRVGGWR